MRFLQNLDADLGRFPGFPAALDYLPRPPMFAAVGTIMGVNKHIRIEKGAINVHEARHG
jgi:hypothetical protein